MDELGPAFLQRGVFIKKEVLKEFLQDLSKDFWTGCQVPRVDGEEVEVDELLRMNWPGNEDPVRIRVQARDPIHKLQKGGEP